MKILYINRSLNAGGFSFEELFKTIKSNLTVCSYTDFYDKTYPNFFKSIVALKKISTDVYHITGGLGYYAFFLPTKKTMLTIHDTNHYEYDLKGLKKWLFGLIYYQIPIYNVKYVTVVSEHTKTRLTQLFNIPEKKIKVIPNCYPNDFKTNIKDNINSTPKVLHIGTKSNKNLSRLIKSLKGLNIELTIVGVLNNNTIELLKEAKTNYINKHNLTREEIYLEYVNTDIVSFISLREGFGLPIVEANVVGRPIISSNTSSMPEVAGNAAILVDPTNNIEIREAFEKLIENQTFRSDLVKRGLDNINRYDPANISQLYNKLYLEFVTH